MTAIHVKYKNKKNSTQISRFANNLVSVTMYLVFLCVGHNTFDMCLGQSQNIVYVFGGVTIHFTCVWVDHKDIWYMYGLLPLHLVYAWVVYTDIARYPSVTKPVVNNILQMYQRQSVGNK